jgi:hypothetical protein
MKEILETLAKLAEVLKLPVTAWTIAAVLLFFLLKGKLVRFRDWALDLVGTWIGGRWSDRRFDPRYGDLVRSGHLHIRLVGIRTEEERRPTVSEAYVPVKLLPKDTHKESVVSVEAAVREHKYCLLLGDPGAGKTTILDYLIGKAATPSPPTPFHRRMLRVCLSFMARNSTAMPIYIPLRRCRHNNPTLLDDILDPATKVLATAIRQKMPKRFIERSLVL